MALQPFSWGANGQKATPSSVKKYAEIAAALANKTGAPQNLGEGLNRIGEALLANSYSSRAAAGEEEGAASRKAVMDALLDNPDPSMTDIAGGLTNEWVASDPGSSAVLQALMTQEGQQAGWAREDTQRAQEREWELTDQQTAADRAAADRKSEFKHDYSLLDANAEQPTVINDQLVMPTTGEVTGDYRDPPDTTKAPTVQKVTLEDGSEMAVQWDGKSQKWVPIDAPEGGGTLKPGKGMTEGQAKLTLFQSLQTETQPVLLDLENQFNPGNIQDAAARSVPIAGNWFQSEQGQIYSSAATAWAEGALRIATGAAATPEEMERTKKAYFAQPGDTPNTIAFKAQMREMYNRAIQKSLGQETSGALPKPSEFAQQLNASNGGGTAAPEAPPAVGAVEDGYRFKGGDPADPNSWEQVQSQIQVQF